jgi:hypothetical protein
VAFSQRERGLFCWRWGLLHGSIRPRSSEGLKETVVVLRYVLRLGVVALSFAFVGCGDPQGRQAITGTVLFKGQPLDKGNIEFMPAGEERTQAGSVIQNGAYAISRRQGLVPGTYKVLISSFEGLPPIPAGGPLPPRSAFLQAKQRIPPQYNTNPTVTVEVKAGGKNTFDFNIE